MNLINFTDQQRQAMLDLAMLAMYADGHLTAAEDERVQRLLTAMGFASEYVQTQQYDAAVARVSRHSGKLETACAHATTLAQNFKGEQGRQVYDILRDLAASDGGIAPQESKLLAAVRSGLGL